MELTEARARGLPLVIDLGDGNERLMAEVFPHPDGIVFADIGWPDSTGHPFHVVAGELQGDGPWTIGRHEIRIAFDGERLFADWTRWQAWRASPAGRRFDAAAAAAEIRRQGLSAGAQYP